MRRSSWRLESITQKVVEIDTRLQLLYAPLEILFAELFDKTQSLAAQPRIVQTQPSDRVHSARGAHYAESWTRLDPARTP